MMADTADMVEKIEKYVQELIMMNNSGNEHKWTEHYSSNHRILVVGEGDFALSLSLALCFRSASNIVASSVDSYDDVIKRHKRTRSNLAVLGYLGARLLHGVDVTLMKLHTDLQMRKFDRIIYSSLHANSLGKDDGSHVTMMHRNLVHGFFMNATDMLHPNGEIHVIHNTNCPLHYLNIEDVAIQNSLSLFKRVDFKPEDYLGHIDKRGDRGRLDKLSPLDDFHIFKFRISPAAKKFTDSDKFMGSHYVNPLQFQDLNFKSFQEPSSLNYAYPLANPSTDTIPAQVGDSSECHWIFSEYFEHAVSTFGQVDNDLPYSVHEALRIGSERYKEHYPGKPLNEYTNLLEELQCLSKLRQQFLRNQLLDNGHQLVATREMVGFI